MSDSHSQDKDMKKVIYLALAAFVLTTAFSCKNYSSGEMELPKVTTLPVQIAGSSSAVLRGSTSGGTEQMLCRGVCFSSSDVFSFEDSPCVSVPKGEGEFSVKTYELIPLHEYNMKAFAVMSDGQVVYGEEMKFSTTDFSLPTVDILDATDIYSTEATLNAELVDEGDYPVSGFGFVYTASADAELLIGASDVKSVTALRESNAFSATISELSIGTTYRVKAYAMTENGPGYSGEYSFTTLNVKPVEFAPIEVVENTFTTLKVRSEVLDDQGSTILEKGFVWSQTEKFPTVKNATAAKTEGDMVLDFGNVLPGRIFYIRCYADTKEMGISYGATLKVKVKTYDGGGMVKIVPVNPVFIGWLGDPEHPELPAKYKMAHDGDFLVNQSVGRSSTPTPSEAVMKPFCIAKYEVTNRAFCEFMNYYGSSIVKDGTWAGQDIFFDGISDITYDAVTESWTAPEEYLDCPVVGVTWYGATAFCEFFGGYMPSEAQWEVAARGNVYSDTEYMYRYSGSDDLNDIAIWANGISRYRCETVGQKNPNQLGIFDMSGNAQEMTSSWWGNYSAIYKECPMPANKQIVLRGGRAQRGVVSSFNNCTRDAYAITATVSYSNFIGFRFACDPDDDEE